jgi:hypothetical protein
MKKLYFPLLVSLLSVVLCTGQNTFNLRERYEFLAAVLTSVVSTDSCYYATGIIADTIFPYNTGAIFLKLDLNGQPIFIKTLKSAEKTYEPWFNGLIPLSDGNFVVSGITIDSAEKSLIIKYNPEGDTIFTKEYFNPAYPSPYIMQPRGGIGVLPDGGFVLSNYVRINSLSTDFYLIRTDSSGNKIWGKIFGNSMWERPESVSITPEGKIVTGGIRTNQNTNTQDYIFQCHLFQVDSSGALEWTWSSQASLGLRDAANDMLLLDDGSIVVASGVGHEQQRASVNEVFFDRHVFKLNPQRELEWEVTFPDSVLTGWSRTTNLMRFNDASGYVVAGMAYSALPPPEYFTILGWFAKITNEGDRLWVRRYAFLSNGENSHKVYDMKEAADGGLIICGQAFSWNSAATYPQQAWLLKLDEHGCLVPGCHLVDSTREPSPGISLALYPNPASDYLNFFVRSPQAARPMTFRIIDIRGRVAGEFKSSDSGATFIVPVWDWAPGVYFLQCVQDGQVVCVEKFVKQ